MQIGTPDAGVANGAKNSPAEQQPAASAFYEMIEQLTSLLSKKGPGISQPTGH